jgi:hypothetical protein
MFNDLTNLGYGLVVFAIIIGVGVIILVNFTASTANCSGLATCGTAGKWNTTTEVCSNATKADCGDPTSPASLNTAYLTTQLGTSGLASWTPAIIAISVGMLFLGAFMVKGNKGRY